MIFYRILNFIFKYPVRWLLAFNVKGAENVPLTGGFIAIGNHTHWFDPVTIALSTIRKFRSMAKAELFDTPVKSFLMRGLGAFPIRRGKGDRGALRKAAAILSSGEAMMMFPEGSRNRTGKLLPFKAGVALLSYRSGCPVVPFAIKYEGGKPLAFRRTRVIVGEAISPSELGIKNEEHGEFLKGAEIIRQRLDALLNEGKPE